MRLEHLFQQAAYTLRGFSVWESRATIASLIDILDILSRGDLKTEMLKELEHQYSALSALSHLPGVDKQQLDNILNQINNAQNTLHNYKGQLGQSLRDNDLLNSLRQRSSITCGCCSFDLPGYHFWLQQIPETRIDQLEEWSDSLSMIEKPISLILSILREGADSTPMTAEQGFYQQSLDSNTPVQMLRITLPEDSSYFPEVSAGKHRFSIRFLQHQNEGRPIQTRENVEFDLWCCSL